MCFLTGIIPASLGSASGLTFLYVRFTMSHKVLCPRVESEVGDRGRQSDVGHARLYLCLIERRGIMRVGYMRPIETCIDIAS